MSHRKRPLPSGKYTATIVSVEIKESILEVTWVIDGGEYSWRNIKENFPLTDWGIEKLQDEMNQLGYIIYTKYDKPLFIRQFLVNRFRATLHIERIAKDDLIKNVIVEHSIADKLAEHDVKRDRKDDHFFVHDEERDLPFDPN